MVVFVPSDPNSKKNPVNQLVKNNLALYRLCLCLNFFYRLRLFRDYLTKDFDTGVK